MRSAKCLFPWALHGALNVFVGGNVKVEINMGSSLLLYPLLMWRSCLCEQSENKEHENHEHSKSNPKADDDGVWKVREGRILLVQLKTTLISALLIFCVWLLFSTGSLTLRTEFLIVL